MSLMVPTEGVEPTHPHGYQILSLARLPIPPRRHVAIEYILLGAEVNKFQRAEPTDPNRSRRRESAQVESNGEK